jgi:hypothetical protein
VRSRSTDTRLLVVGVVAFLALVVYLGVAFATTHTSTGSTPSEGDPFLPWVPKYHSTLRLVPRTKGGGGIAVQALPRFTGEYGAVVPTLAAQPPPGSTVVVHLRLRGPGQAPIRVLIDQFPAGPHPNLVDTTVPASAHWRRYTFRARVKGRWLGVGLFVGRDTGGKGSRWFAVRGLAVRVR